MALVLQRASERMAYADGPFRIWRSYPGRGVAADSGLGPIGAVDHGDLLVGLRVPMHEHKDDEIISYLRSGVMMHTDSSGRNVELSPGRLMVMNAGSGLSHEESVPAEAARVRMLQIFVRPRALGLEPGVQFGDVDPVVPDAEWRLLVGAEGTGAAIYVRSAVDLYDTRLGTGDRRHVPARTGCGWWIYVFSGEVEIDGMRIGEGDSLASPGESEGEILAHSDAEIVCFVYDLAAPYTDRGTLSGRRRLRGTSR
ncbi:MAG: pirin family protein [Planctomycetota bacterium]